MYIYAKNKTTPRKLAKYLGCRFGKAMPYSYTPSQRRQFLVSWGGVPISRNGEVYKSPTNVNSRLFWNKLEALQAIQRAGVKTPEPCLYGILLSRRLDMGDFIYKSTNAFTGKRLGLWKAKTPCPSNVDQLYFMPVIDKKAEYRVHILFCRGCSKVHDYYIQVKKKGSDNAHDIFWKNSKGWKFVGLAKNDTGQYSVAFKKRLLEAAEKSVRALDYDFGAVDIIVGQDNKIYVLEVNSAPGIDGQGRIEMYGEYFKHLETHWRVER